MSTFSQDELNKFEEAAIHDASIAFESFKSAMFPNSTTIKSYEHIHAFGEFWARVSGKQDYLNGTIKPL